MPDDRSAQPTPTPRHGVPHTRHQDSEPPGGDPGADVGRGLVRVTFNLTPRAADALDAACARTRDTKTDTLNRALVVYNVVLGLMDRGGGRLTFQTQDGHTESVHLL